jgi:hypothetical protein
LEIFIYALLFSQQQKQNQYLALSQGAKKINFLSRYRAKDKIRLLFQPMVLTREAGPIHGFLGAFAS